MNFLKELPCAILLIYTVIIIWSKLLNRKINYKDYKLYVLLIFLSTISILNFYLVNNFIKIIMISIVMAIGCCFIFRCEIKKAFILAILTQVLIMISDVIIAIIFASILDLENYASNFQISPIIINIIASILCLSLYKILFIKKLYNFIINKTKKIKNLEIILLSLSIIVFGSSFSVQIYNESDFRIIIIVNILFTVFCFVIVLYSLKTKNNYNKVYDKYNTTLNSLKEYEDILDKYRISNHENKNQLLTLRNMLPKTNKKPISYIDSIIDNKLKDDEKIMYEASKIPSGGLRGLIYSKILIMKELNIEYDLEISNEIKTVDLINIDDSLMLDVCKVIGVYLDNAIQAVQNLKEKYINIQLYLDVKNLIISISNNYEGVIKIDKIEEKGYSSKGKNHGYGLTLAKEIINNNKNLSNEKRLSKEIFSQILKIKM